jgi:hypothetical protein
MMSRIPDGAMFESFGFVVEVLTDDPELLRRLPEGLAEWRPAAATRASASFGVMLDGTITCDGVVLARTAGRPTATLATLAIMLRRHLAVHAPDHLFVHAGVVGIGGIGLVIPGRSFSGKSTLVAELLRQGATYYSDEFAAVDADGLIHAYPRPLSLRPEWGGAGSVPAPPVVEVGTTPIRAGLIVVTRYERGAGWRPVTGTHAQAAIALLENTVAVRSRPGFTLTTLRRLAGASQVLIGIRGEAARVAEALLGAVAPAATPPDAVSRPARV